MNFYILYSCQQPVGNHLFHKRTRPIRRVRFLLSLLVVIIFYKHTRSRRVSQEDRAKLFSVDILSVLSSLSWSHPIDHPSFHLIVSSSFLLNVLRNSHLFCVHIIDVKEPSYKLIRHIIVFVCLKPKLFINVIYNLCMEKNTKIPLTFHPRR